ncbi:MAG: FtsX-like permease family protein [bacterium]|nr:FtsX-like permease family protein [bacterium]
MSAMLAVTLAIPVCLAGLTFAFGAWLRPLADLGNERLAIPVLLHPVMEQQQRSEWLNQKRQENPDWLIREVPPEQLSDRLSHWFPYLTDLLKDDPTLLLPQLIEVETARPETLDMLSRSPAVIAVGPRSSVHRTIASVASKLKWLALAVTLALLASAALLTGVWIHLELYRHADEITIMRLIGATEGMIRGPFMVAVTVPGVAAGILAAVGTTSLASAVSRFTGAAGLPPVEVSMTTTILQLIISAGLPIVTGLVTLSHHAYEESSD